MVKTAQPAGVPNYTGLRIASTVLMTLALLGYVAGPIAIFGGFMDLHFSGRNQGATQEDVDLALHLQTEGFTLLYSGVGLFVAAAIQHGLSEACIAVRDIARNSWSLRERDAPGWPSDVRMAKAALSYSEFMATVRHPTGGPSTDEKSPQTTERCANCGAKIHHQQTPYVWNNNVVCAACHARLSTADAKRP